MKDISVITDPHETWVVNSVGMGAVESIRAHAEALRMLIEAEEPYAIEIGPYGDDWWRLVAYAGTWVRGEGVHVKRFVEDWTALSGSNGVAVAPYLTWSA